jgi:threonine/homoserine/homoserine lactone efflux protein
MIDASWLVFVVASLVLIATPGRLFVDGAISNPSNPKIAIFHFAFLPQFVAPSAHSPTLTVFVLGRAFERR